MANNKDIENKLDLFGTKLDGLEKRLEAAMALFKLWGVVIGIVITLITFGVNLAGYSAIKGLAKDFVEKNLEDRIYEEITRIIKNDETGKINETVKKYLDSEELKKRIIDRISADFHTERKKIENTIKQVDYLTKEINILNKKINLLNTESKVEKTVQISQEIEHQLKNLDAEFWRNRYEAVKVLRDLLSSELPDYTRKKILDELKLRSQHENNYYILEEIKRIIKMFDQQIK